MFVGKNPDNLDRFVDMFGRGVSALERRMDTEESPVKSDSETPKLSVEQIDNHVYFYADVDTDRTLALIRNIRELDGTLRNQHSSRMLGESYPQIPIWLHIQSGGGDLFAGLAAADQLRQIESPIFSVIEGFCASAATLLSLVCDRRYILPNAYMMIHQFSTWKVGKFRDFEDEMRLMKMLMKTMIHFYSTYSDVSEKEIEALLDRDSWFSAEQCVEKGFADSVLS